MKIKRTKKAQYYVVSAIVLCSLAVVLISSNMMGAKDRSVFSELRENFLTEAYISLNNAAGNGEFLPTAFDSFIQDFQDYADGRNIDFNLVSMLLVDGRIYITNYVDTPITILTTYHDIQLNSSESINISALNVVTVQKDSREYLFVFNENPIQLRALFEIKVK